MSAPEVAPASAKASCIIDRAGLALLLRSLQARGYTVVGPTVADGAIVYDELAGIDELPAGWTDEQAPGRYRLRRRDDAALFGYNVGPHAWKRFLYPPEQRLWRLRRSETGFEPVDAQPPPPRYALLGVRACELTAIAVQDRVFLGHEAPDPVYQARRGEAFIVAVNCTRAGGTCFCTSMDAGPRTGGGYDLALTEFIDAQRHEFLVEVGSVAGGAVLDDVFFDSPAREATGEDHHEADRLVDECAASMGRALDNRTVPALLARNLEHPRWDDVAERCLACANCTLVCPTCFCSEVADTADLRGEIAERWRRWDSCFEKDFSYIHGGSVRDSTRSRYRQWMTHKLATWYEQFGSSGCVGCGRCITWCPVGIDITEEAAAIQADDRGATEGTAS